MKDFENQVLQKFVYL